MTPAEVCYLCLTLLHPCPCLHTGWFPYVCGVFDSDLRVFHSLCLVEPQMCTKPAPRPHTYYHSVLPSSILPRSIKASLPGVCIVNQALTIRPWLDPTHIQKQLIYLFIFPLLHGIKMHDVWPRWHAHFQLLFIAFAGQPVKQQAQTGKIKWDFFFFFLRPCCADFVQLLQSSVGIPLHPQMHRSGIESVQVFCHCFREWTRLYSKTGPRWPFFFHEYAQIFIEKLQGAKCRSRWSRVVMLEKRQRCCFWEMGIMGMGLVFRTALYQRNYFICFLFFFFNSKGFWFIMKAEIQLASGFYSFVGNLEFPWWRACWLINF